MDRRTIDYIDAFSREYRDIKYTGYRLWRPEGKEDAVFAVDEDVYKVERIEGSKNPYDVCRSLEYFKPAITDGYIEVPCWKDEKQKIQIWSKHISSGSGINWREYREKDLSSVEINQREDLPLNILFLDMDGVFMGDRYIGGCKLREDIHETLYKLYGKKGHDEYNGKEWVCAYAQNLYPRAVSFLNALLHYLNERCRVRLVLTSSWATYCTKDELTSLVFKHHAFSRFFIDNVPPIEYCKRNAITQWLQKNKVDNYVIFDDDDLRLKGEMVNHLVHVNTNSCLCLLDIVKAASILFPEDEALSTVHQYK